MYITITPQKLEMPYSQSVSNFVAYLEKENQLLEHEETEHFFNQYGEEITEKEVIQAIDCNTAKLKKTEPKFYSITVSPSQYELNHLHNSNKDLKDYTRALMKDYVASFNRDIDGRPIQIDDIKYYAKIERQRVFKGTDRQVKENQPFANEILKIRQEIRKIERGEAIGNMNQLQEKIRKLEQDAPHQQNGKRIVQGMKKSGDQSHIHIIVSRKDASNRYSLSPGSKYKASEVVMNGKTVKRGFDRDQFFIKSEQTFDKMFHYKRNFAEHYQSRKQFVKNPKLYFNTLLGLPHNEKAVAFKMLENFGIPITKIPTNKVQVALKAIKILKRSVSKGMQSGSIGI